MNQYNQSFQVYNASAGSGKTFTLVKEYLKILLVTDDLYRFQNILAITFTNKAATEMKERVLKNLRLFSKGDLNVLAQEVLKETGLSEQTLEKRSNRVLNAILQNYSAFNITTIDSFTHRIIRNFAFDLGLSFNFDVEMDGMSLIEEAVAVLIAQIGLNKELTDTLVQYAISKTDEDKSWDISTDLYEMGRVLLNESDVDELEKIKNKPIEAFLNLEKKLKEQQTNTESKFKELGQQGLSLIEQNGLIDTDFFYKDVPNFFKKVLDISVLNPERFFTVRLEKNIEKEQFYGAKIAVETKHSIDGISADLIALYNQIKNLYESSYKNYILNGLILKNLIPLAVLKHINISLDEIKEQNNLRLNAEFNQLISDKIKDEPAPFIYERLGEKFRYYFVDEMQDTSKLQWGNLIPLIENALTSQTFDEQHGNLMLVGDGKQAIYRWRGGESEQFIGLSNEDNPFSITKEVKNLESNFRSYNEIIGFNNHFFQYASSFLTNDDYQQLYIEGNQQQKQRREGGYVEISFVETKGEDTDEVYGQRVLDIIQQMDANIQWKDICVLVRKKKEGTALANYLSERAIDIVSSETLLLKNNETINFIINLLSYINTPENQKALAEVLFFIAEQIGVAKDKVHDFVVERISLPILDVFKSFVEFDFKLKDYEQLPFYEGVEYIIRNFKIRNVANVFVFSFLDIVLEYQQKNGSDIREFLSFWESKKEVLSVDIPEGQNAIKIMTIHKSKGLEFPVVIYPYDLDIYREVNPKVWYQDLEPTLYDDFETLLIPYSKQVSYTGEYGESIYSTKREELQLDSLNLLYVALTRPVQQLYVITEKRSKVLPVLEAKYFSDLFLNYVEEHKELFEYNQEVNSYSIGSKKYITVEELEEPIEKIQHQQFISSARHEQNITVVSNASLLWNTDQELAISYGNLVHEVLSKIYTEQDISGVIKQYIFDGAIDEVLAQDIERFLYQIVRHKDLKHLYQPDLLVFNEQEIVAQNKQIQIPDRFVVMGNKVSVVDYKTGEAKLSHQDQISGYAYTLQQMDYEIVQKILVYLTDQITVVIVP